MASDSRVHAFNEVIKHNKTDDCWIIINGKVYDVTPFMEDHPGGAEVILSSTGRDSTSDFEDIDHSDSAREMMEKYCIGRMDMKTVPAKRATTPSHHIAALKNSDNLPESFIKILQFLVPLFVLGTAFAVRLYTKNN